MLDHITDNNSAMWPISPLYPNMNIGLGYIILPLNVKSREDYIKNCYLKNTVSLFDPIAKGTYINCIIDEEKIKQIKFPTNESQFGSIVLFNILPVNGIVVIMAIIKSKGEYLPLEENSYRFRREYQDVLIDLFVKAQSGEVDLDIISTSEQPATLNIRVKNKSKTSQVNFEIAGDLNISDLEKLSILMRDSLNIALIDTNDKIIGQISYNTLGFTLKDQFGNLIKINKDGLSVSDNFDNKITTSIDGLKYENKNQQLSLNKDGISLLNDKTLGIDNVAIGSQVVKILNELITKLSVATVGTPSGTSTPFLNVADLLSLQTELSSIVSDSVIINKNKV